MKIENTSQERITSVIKEQKEYFDSGATLSIEFRRRMLSRLLEAMYGWEKPLCDALYKDLHKSYEEAYLTEISIVLCEIKSHLKHIKSWSKPCCRPTPLKLFPSKSRVVTEPLGTSLIVSPWNYPVQLLLNPLVGAISSGCTAVLKPSPYTPNVAMVVEQMIAETFDEKYIATVQGNRDVNTMLLAERYDIIFFTGSPSLGRIVMTEAARHITPVVLELGGKSPCIVDSSADIEIAARRIAWGKTLNAGQTCIAPDYLMIHSSVKDKFIEAFARQIKNLHTENPRQSRNYVRIVNEQAFDRIVNYLHDGDILYGGDNIPEELYIEPTILGNVSPESPVMQEEIFGPVLPLITFEDIDSVVSFISNREKPLALYYFGSEHTGRYVIRHTSSGGACINDTIMHIANENVPFGGVGNSGMGQYHGKESYNAFSHKRAVISSSTRIDLPFRYMPYKLFNLVKKIL